ncbi:universal stress protein [Allobacillus sp. GCM10007491]|uniref:Universal stress protein n=1 Tax=Allobacillus saliphilus TaxID=2912308 RepID=A0A941HSM1_9BACI|nr:universal stress protein [Allobacillus saliphilus]MBR7553886.1 universal stress protein [Allobacillus saliphilus]MBR7554830.1 universal stress protein [Allobacillus saliphilus]
MLKDYENILVAVDGSKNGEKAFNKACRIAKNVDARLVIAHVVDYRTFATIEHYSQTILPEVERVGKELLKEYEEKATQLGVEQVTTVLEFGSPRQKIPKTIAKKYEIDLILTGATGLNAVERVMLGSVSEAITRTAPCDVLIVRSE